MRKYSVDGSEALAEMAATAAKEEAERDARERAAEHTA